MRAAESCHCPSQMSGHRPFRCKVWVRSQLLLPTQMNGQATVTRLHCRRKSIELVKPQRICRPLAFHYNKADRCLPPVESITWQHLATHIRPAVGSALQTAKRSTVEMGHHRQRNKISAKVIVPTATGAKIQGFGQAHFRPSVTRVHGRFCSYSFNISIMEWH
jgi:hypothetical protein